MFALTWRGLPLDRMAEVYVLLDLDAQDQLAGAVEKLNTQLRTNPLDVGESRDIGYRLVFLPGLQVLFHVDLMARAVEVIDAGPSRR